MECREIRDEKKLLIKIHGLNNITCRIPYYVYSVYIQLCISHQSVALGESYLLFFLEFQFTLTQVYIKDFFF